MGNSTNKNKLETCLKNLRLSGVRAYYEELTLMAEQETMRYDEYLLELLLRECELRYNNRIARLLRESRLPLEKNFDNFDIKRLPPKLQHQVKAILDGTFVDRKENILAFGNPGSGKTHLLSALGLELVHKNRRVLYTTCSLLVQELLIAKKELELKKVLRKLSRFDVLIIDDFGYVQQEREEMEVLFTLMNFRYERESIMIASNLPFSKWEVIFKDPMTTAAAIDRLVHHSVILEMNIPSYRMEEAKKGENRRGVRHASS
ncbi:MAG: ATP-binding protein [Candidatus Aminicenantes bacterium]|nr:ATP-binding protein [Candidatus Aminicenantes bacterium]